MRGLVILCLGLMTLMFAGCGDGEKQAQNIPTPETPAPIKPAAPATEHPNPMFEEAKEIIKQQGCGSCHTLQTAGLDLSGKVGPDLTNESARNKTAEWIRQQLTDPTSISNEQVAPGFEGQQIVMPSYGRILKSEELDLLVNFLLSLGKE